MSNATKGIKTMKTRKATGRSGRMEVQVEFARTEWRRANNWKLVADAIANDDAQEIVPSEWTGATGVVIKGWRWRVERLVWISVASWQQITGRLYGYSSDDYYCGTAATFAVTETPEVEPDFLSDFGSQYWYTNKGVIRRANHWGRVASCKWQIDTKDGGWATGFCAWASFKPNN